MSTQKREDVLRLIKTGELTMKQVSDVLDVDYNNVTRIVRSYVKRGVLVEIPPRPDEPKTTKRFRLSQQEMQRELATVSPDSIAFKSLKFIEENHPDELYDKDDLNSRFERAVAMMLRFPETSDIPKRRSNANQAKNHVNQVLQEYERGADILRDLLAMELVSNTAFPILRTNEARAFVRHIAERVQIVKQKNVDVEEKPTPEPEDV